MHIVDILPHKHILIWIYIYKLYTIKMFILNMMGFG